MVHQIRISLIGSEPEIWRSFKVNSAATFEELHGIDKKHPGKSKMLEWLGGGFDPEYFNLKNINVILAKYKFRRNRKNPLVANRANCRLKTS
jgi:hypothetical protein